MPKIQVNNIELYYEMVGHGPTLVLVSGLGTDHSIWASVFHRFTKHYRVLLVDNRGSGQSEAPPGDYTIDIMADDLVQLCQALSITTAHFIGSSMGGAIVQNLAYRYPEQIQSLTLVNSSAKFDPIISLHGQACRELAQQHASIPESLIKMIVCWSYSGHYLSKKNRLNQLVNRRINHPYPTSFDSINRQINALQLFDSNMYLMNIKAPCLVTGSDQDRLCMEHETRALAAGIPHAHYVLFKNCGHLPQVEYPQRLTAVIRDFVSQHE